jgi:hypothetical protein
MAAPANLEMKKPPTSRSIQRRETLEFEFELPFPPWMA